MNLRIYLEDQLKVLILLHKLGQNAILGTHPYLSFPYISLIRAPMGMSNCHSLKFPFSPVFAV